MSNEEHALEQEAANKLLDAMITNNARDDIKSQVKDFAHSFHKKCSNKSIQIDTLIQDYASFKDALKKRIQTNLTYRGKANK